MDNMSVLRELIANCISCDVDKNAISENSTFEQLNMDSMDTMELIMAVEERFDILINDNGAVKSVADLLYQIDTQTQDTVHAKAMPVNA